MKYKKNDIVTVLVGKDRGKRGRLLQVKDDRILVEGINIVFKSIKQNPQKNISGGIEKKESSIHISNVMLFDEKQSMSGRVGYKFDEQGKKERVIRTRKKRES